MKKSIVITLLIISMTLFAKSQDNNINERLIGKWTLENVYDTSSKKIKTYLIRDDGKINGMDLLVRREINITQTEASINIIEGPLFCGVGNNRMASTKCTIDNNKISICTRYLSTFSLGTFETEVYEIVSIEENKIELKELERKKEDLFGNVFKKFLITNKLPGP